MYAHFYHLSENPFNLTPDPKFHYINESTREALAAVLYGIKSRKGFLTLIGEAGTGKTTLLRRIVDEIEGETRIVFVFNPGVSFDELLEYLCMELGIRAEGGGRLQLIERLNQFLLEQLTDGRNVVVIIDEAQTLEDGVLEELRLLSNLETSKEKILQIVLSGQPELEEKLRRPNLRQLRQRIGVRATLKPMRSDEIRAYVETRLRSAGGQKAELFTASALHRCWQASQGIPRVINVICDNAMMVAFAEGNDRITVSVMNAAIRDLDGLTVGDSLLGRIQAWMAAPALRYGALTVAVVAGAFALGRALNMPDEAPTRIATSAPGVATPAVASLPAPAARPAAPTPVAVEAPRIRETPAIPAAAPALAAAPAAVEARPATNPAAAEARPAVESGLPPAVAAPEVGLRESTPASSPAREPLPTNVGLYADAPPEAASVSTEQNRESLQDSRRRAEEIARATAARLYGATPPPVTTERPAPPSPRVAERPTEDAEAMAAQAMRHPEVAAVAPQKLPEPAKAPVDAPKLPVEAPPSVAAPPTGLAGGLETVASLSGEAARRPKAGGKPLVGRHVRVTRGDTVWAIAMQYYGTVDSSVLTEIFRHNPGIRNAHQLPVGTDVFVPFLKPEHMVDPVQGGGYRVLVAESPEAGEIAKASDWAASRLPGRELRTTSKGRDNPVRMVYATGFTGREAALTAAKQLLGPGQQ